MNYYYFVLVFVLVYDDNIDLQAVENVVSTIRRG